MHDGTSEGIEFSTSLRLEKCVIKLNYLGHGKQESLQVNLAAEHHGFASTVDGFFLCYEVDERRGRCL